MTARQVRAAMRDARRLVGVDHVNICAVAAACFDSVSSDPAWFVYHCSATSTHLKTFLDESRTQTNVRRCYVILSHREQNSLWSIL